MQGVRRMYPQPPYPRAPQPANPLDATGLPEGLADTGAPEDFESSYWHPDMQSFVIGGDQVGAMPLAPGEALVGVDVDLLMDETIAAMESQIAGETVDFGGIMDRAVRGVHVVGGEYESRTQASLGRMRAPLFAGRRQPQGPISGYPTVGSDPPQVVAESRELRQRIRETIAKRGASAVTAAPVFAAGGLVVVGLAALVLIALLKRKK